MLERTLTKCPFIKVLVVISPLVPLTPTAISFQPGLQYQAYITSCGVVVTYNYNVVCCSQNIHVIIASVGIFCMAVQNYSTQSLFLFVLLDIF